VSAFKFPRINTKYTVFYATREADGTLVEVEEEESGAIPHAYFDNELSYDEIEVIIA
jgi:hypothetical protein